MDLFETFCAEDRGATRRSFCFITLEDLFSRVSISAFAPDRSKGVWNVISGPESLGRALSWIDLLPLLQDEFSSEAKLFIGSFCSPISERKTR